MPDVVAAPFDDYAAEAVAAASPEAWQASREAELRHARKALKTASRDPDRLNGLGVALLAFAGTDADTKALGAIEEAQRRFSRAAEEASRQSAPAAALRRFTINRALALWMLGKRRNDRATIEHALEILAPVLADLDAENTGGPQLQVDWARALDIKGNALAALDKIDAATEAYDAALGKTKEPKALARILRNLAITLMAARRHSDAHKRLQHGLTKINPSADPLAWAKVQSILGDTLAGWAESIPDDPQEARQGFDKAMAAYRAAQDAYKQAGARREALSLSVPMAIAQVQFGAQFCMPTGPADPQAGLLAIDEAIAELAASMIELPSRDQERARHVVDIAKNVLNSIESAYSKKKIHETIFQEKAIKFRENCAIIENVSNDNTNTFHKLVALLSSLPDAERREELRKIGDHFNMPLREAAEELSAPPHGLPTQPLERAPTVASVPGMAPSPPSSMPLEARLLFGDAPASKGPRTYTKSKFPPEWFENKEVIAAARKTAVEYKKLDKAGALNPETVERGRTATRFIRQYERLQSRATARSGAQPKL